MANSERSTTNPPILKQAAMQIVAGGSAGFVEVCIMHPLDLVKTRLQLQTRAVPPSATAVGGGTGGAVYYNGVFDCFAKMYRHEGIGSLWKGIIPPILAETPKRATKFVCFEQFKRFFLFGSDRATPLVSYGRRNACAVIEYHEFVFLIDVFAGWTGSRRYRSHYRESFRGGKSVYASKYGQVSKNAKKHATILVMSS